MLSKNKLDSLNIQEIDDLQAESLSGGAFGFRRNSSGTRGRRFIERGSRRSFSHGIGDTITLDNINSDGFGDFFFVTYFGGNNGDQHLDVNIVRSGEDSPAAPSGTTRAQVVQATRAPFEPVSDDLLFDNCEVPSGNIQSLCIDGIS